MGRLKYPRNRGAERSANQTEFPLPVAVCAWCKPKERNATVGALSHGICPRHFREMKIGLQNDLPDREGAPVGQRTRRPRRLRRSIEDIAQLRFPFPAPVVAASSLSA
jgi:hypothetical protein